MPNNEIPEVFNLPSDTPPQRWSDKVEYFRQNPMYPLYGDYIQDFPPLPSISPPSIAEPSISLPPITLSPPSQEDFNTTLDELEGVINDLFLTIRGMRSKNYDF